MAEVNYNEAYYEVEASRWIGGADASIAWVNFAKRNTKNGEQWLAQLHCRCADGNIRTVDVWPRDLATKDDLDALTKASVADIFLRFGRKPEQDAKGNPVTVKDANGKETWKYTDQYGKPKWVAYITADGETVSLNGGAVPFDGLDDDSEASDSSANAE